MIIFHRSTLVTAQYSWQYGTGKSGTGPAAAFDLYTYKAISFSETSAYRLPILNQLRYRARRNFKVCLYGTGYFSTALTYSD